MMAARIWLYAPGKKGLIKLKTTQHNPRNSEKPVKRNLKYRPTDRLISKPSEKSKTTTMKQQAELNR